MKNERLRSHNSDKWFAQKMVSPTFAVLLCMSVFPLIFTAYYSLTDYYYISRDPIEFIGLNNFIKLFKDTYFRSALFNTIKFTVLCTAFETFFGVIIACFVNSIKKGKNIIRIFILLPYLLPPVTAALIWQVLLSNNYGIVNTILEHLNLPVYNWFFDTKTAMATIIVIDTWQCTPFCFLLLYAALQTISPELYEAARVDGANVMHEFFYITLPSLKNTITLCLLLRTIDSFRMFDKINVLTGGGPANTTATITQYIYTYGIKNLKFGFASAGCIVMVMLVLLLSSFYMKRAIKFK